MTMRFLPAVLTVAFLAVKFSTAQSDPDIPTPRSFGLGAGVKIRDILENTGYTRSSLRHDRRAHLDTRQQGGTDGRCGPDGDGASCADGFCCSDSGWCGNTSEMCAAPQCQIDFGPGCDAHKVPSGDSTREIPRPHLGDIPYGGEGVRSCVEPGTLAITYDDGPYIYTNDILDQFASYGMRATFFITGNNLGKGAIDDSSTPWPAVIRRMTSEGHQVASHTWSHQDLSVITPQQRLNELIYNEMAFRNVIGAFPTYMRPPYLSCSEACQQDLSDLGYVIVYPDLDTNDWRYDSPELIQTAKDIFVDSVGNSDATTQSFITLNHDNHQQTAYYLTDYMLQMVQSKGYRAVTVGECLGDPDANWYRFSPA